MSTNGMPSAGEGFGQGIMRAADALPSSHAGQLIAQEHKSESKRRLVEARTFLFRSERDYIAEMGNANRDAARQAQWLEERAAQIEAETRAIEADAQVTARLLLKQAELERHLAERIRTIADRNALAVLEKVEEASNSIMNWAEVAANDIGMIMKEEAADQVSRKMSDINAVRDAMEDEERAAELLDLAAKMRTTLAA